LKCYFTSTETVGLLGTEAQGRSPRLSHSLRGGADSVRFIGTISVDRWRNNYDGVLEEVRRDQECWRGFGTIKGEWTEKGEIRARQKS